MPLIATDGSSLGTQTEEGRKGEGPGAFAVVIHFEADHDRSPNFQQVLTGGRKMTTTGEIELLGFLCAVETIRDYFEAHEADPDNALVSAEDHFTIVVDSEYVAKGWSQHLDEWIANDWRTSGFRRIKHQVVWQDVQDIRAQYAHAITVVHQPGHTRKSADVDVDPYVAINDEADRAAGVASRAIRETGFVPNPTAVVWQNKAQSLGERDADIRKLQALAERVLKNHGRSAAVEAFRLATHTTGVTE